MNIEKNGLSERLQAVADLVSPGKRVCDVGCDHGYVSIYLIESGKADAVLAMDVNRGPLERARINVEKHGLTGYITLRLSNGLDAYRTGEAQSLVIAGMGGRLMQSILTKDKQKTEDFEELILQPQSELALFRKFLRTEGYVIVQEEMILEGGKFYPMMKAQKKPAGGSEHAKADAGVNSDPVNAPAGSGQREETASEEQQDDFPDVITQELADTFGPCLLAQRNPVLYEYIFRQKEDILRLIHAIGQEESERCRKRREELKAELSLLTQAESLYQ